MTRQEFREAYYTHSGKASEVARTLALSGIAVIWIFAIDGKDGSYTLPRELLWPGLFIVACLACDLLQYAVAAAIWGFYHRRLEKKKVPANKEVGAPPWFNWPGLFFFWTKLGTVVVAYGLLATFVWKRLFNVEVLV